MPNTSEQFGRTPEIMRRARDPIAIVGVGCRFPGDVFDTESYWNMLVAGQDCIVDVPQDRWSTDRFFDPDPDKTGKIYIKHGGFLKHRLEAFDAAFFGIPPRQADTIDPQQRLLLETTWEAFEDAGIVPEALAGSATGVYVGGFNLDSLLTQLSPLNRRLVNSHTATGMTMTVLSNRISYLFDLRGPSVTMDTACSSSLVAFHHACQAIWNGECSLALTGGVNVMFRPEYSLTMCKGQFLAPDGHCKSFDERADGYARAEGAAIVVLKPLEAARKDGDRIYAIVRGTGVNQDGRTNGISLPNGESQAALIRSVLDQANIAAQQIGYVEAHGTGTAVGDPIEATAIGTVLGKNRPDDMLPLVIGSVKANFGHLEAAAGIAGVIKAALCLEHGQIPPQANLQALNPAIPFADLRLKVPQQLETLPEGEGSVCAAINSFGYGGTNAHVILERMPARPSEMQAHPDQTAAPAIERPLILALSTRDQAALVPLARGYRQLLRKESAPALADVCHSAAVRRSHLEHRVAFVAATAGAMVEQLDAFIEQGVGPSFITNRASSSQSHSPVFVFTGMGPQWWAMGRQLLVREPVFRATAEACDAAFQGVAGWSILAEMTAEEHASNIADTRIAQPANVLLQIALTALWRSWGVEPAAIIGHSVGEVGAAYASGMLTQEQCMTVAYHRSQVQKMAAGKGKMLALGMSAAEAEELLVGLEHSVSLAAINGPSTVTLAGDPAPLESIAARAEEQGVFYRFLQVEVAYHSPHMAPLWDNLATALDGLSPALPTTPLYSTVTGARFMESGYDAEYWCRNMCQTVHFSQAMNCLIADGYRLFLEVGPHPVLAASIKEHLGQHGVAGEVHPSLYRGNPEQQTLLETAAKLHVAGCNLDWRSLIPQGGQFVRLPNYPWQRQDFWIESEESLLDRRGWDTHPLLGRPLNGPGKGWEDDLCRGRIPYLDDHQVDGATVFPGAGYAEIGLAIHRALGQTDICLVEDLEFLKGLVIDPSNDPHVRVDYDAQSRDYLIYSRSADERNAWQCHARGRLSFGKIRQPAAIDLAALQQRSQHEVAGQDLYRELQERGLQYGPMFQTIRCLRRWPGEVLAQITVQAGRTTDQDRHYQLHPTLLDGCFQSMLAALNSDRGDWDDQLYVPVRIRQIRLYVPPSGMVWAYGRVTERTADEFHGDIALCDGAGIVLAEVRGLECRALARGKAQTQSDAKRWSYILDWEQMPVSEAGSAAGKWLVLHDAGGVGDSLSSALLARGVEVTGLGPGAGRDALGPGACQVRPDAACDLDTILAQAGETYRAIVDLRALDTQCTDADPIGSQAATAVLHLVQTLARRLQPSAPRLYLITRGAQQIHPDEPLDAPAQATVIGMGRVIASEHAQLRCTRIDLGPLESEPDSLQVQTLTTELLADGPATEVALRGTQRFIPRLTPESLEDTDSHQKPVAKVPGKTPMTLERDRNGSLEGLHFREVQRRAPGLGEVELEIQAVALNFKDVLKTMDMIADEALENTYYGDTIGMEVAAIVARVGADVTTLQPGMEIVALLRNSFSSYVTESVDAFYWMPRPSGMSHAQTASLPITFVTAWYGLHELAKLQPCERVLIHAGAGGVGQAAIQIARWLGAEIFATAGNDEKRALLREQGVQHVMDSRSLEFADEVQTLTDGVGVDVVLNSLAGETALKSMDLLAPWGRFIEIGKRDFINNQRLEMRPFNRGLSYFALDIDRMMGERPETFRRSLCELSELFRANVLVAPPITVFPADQTVDAFRHMAESKNIGKIVVSMRTPNPVQVLPVRDSKPLCSPQYSYLITGGLRGFGLEVSKWLIKQGARHLVLVGRRAATTQEAIQAIDEMQVSGAHVRAIAADVANADDVQRIFAEIDGSMPPLRGIMHAAGVLDDAPLMEQSEVRMNRVMHPKALGAWHLHQASRHRELDFFVLFSSISALVGNPGQANYVAANSFLDALARHRRVQGLSGTSINWGAINRVGMAARDQNLLQHLARQGIRAMEPELAAGVIAPVLQISLAQIGVMDVDWTQWAAVNPTAMTDPRFERLLAAQAQGDDADDEYDLVQALRELEPQERGEMVNFLLADLLAETLRLPVDKIVFEQSLTSMGLDSLMTAELQMKIKDGFGVDYSTMELLQGGDIEQIGKTLLTRLGLDGDRAKAPREADQPHQVDLMTEVEIDALTEVEIDALLDELMVEED